MAGKKKVKGGAKLAAAVTLGKLGGAKGGNARAKALGKKERVAIAKQGAKARWQDSNRNAYDSPDAVKKFRELNP